jgi:NADH-quinone oxidoreductase subunit C
MLSNQEIVEDLFGHFGDKVNSLEEPHGLLSFTTPKDNILEVIKYLNEHERFRFTFLTDITAVHLPDNTGKEFAVVYHLHSWENKTRIRIKVFCSNQDLTIPSATALYASANWMERETYDFFGIQFTGHPNLKRILNIDEMDYFPMRKEYPLEDATREDKIDALFGR